MTSGRKPIGDMPMTVAVRKRRQRAKAKEMGIPTRDQLITAFGKAIIELAPEIQNDPLYGRIAKRTEEHLIKLNFKRRPIQDALKQHTEGDGTK